MFHAELCFQRGATAAAQLTYSRYLRLPAHVCIQRGDTVCNTESGRYSLLSVIVCRLRAKDTVYNFPMYLLRSSKPITCGH